MNFKPPVHDIQTREVYLNHNLQVKWEDKLFFLDIKVMHLVGGYYLRDTFIGVNVWLDLRISYMCLIKESNVCAVEKSDNSLYIHIEEGYYLERRTFSEELHDEIINDINNEQKYDDKEEADNEVVLSMVVHGTSKVVWDINN